MTTHAANPPCDETCGYCHPEAYDQAEVHAATVARRGTLRWKLALEAFMRGWAAHKAQAAPALSPPGPASARLPPYPACGSPCQASGGVAYCTGRRCPEALRSLPRGAR